MKEMLAKGGCSEGVLRMSAPGGSSSPYVPCEACCSCARFDSSLTLSRSLCRLLDVLDPVSFPSVVQPPYALSHKHVPRDIDADHRALSHSAENPGLPHCASSPARTFSQSHFNNIPCSSPTPSFHDTSPTTADRVFFRAADFALAQQSYVRPRGTPSQRASWSSSSAAGTPLRVTYPSNSKDFRESRDGNHFGSHDRGTRHLGKRVSARQVMKIVSHAFPPGVSLWEPRPQEAFANNSFESMGSYCSTSRDVPTSCDCPCHSFTVKFELQEVLQRNNTATVFVCRKVGKLDFDLLKKYYRTDEETPQSTNTARSGEGAEMPMSRSSRGSSRDAKRLKCAASRDNLAVLPQVPEDLEATTPSETDGLIGAVDRNNYPWRCDLHGPSWLSAPISGKVCDCGCDRPECPPVVKKSNAADCKSDDLQCLSLPNSTRSGLLMTQLCATDDTGTVYGPIVARADSGACIQLPIEASGRIASVEHQTNRKLRSGGSEVRSRAQLCVPPWLKDLESMDSVVVKVLHRNKGTSKELARMSREIEYLRSMSHPNLLTMIAAFEGANETWLLLERATYHDLKKVTDRQTFCESIVKLIMRQLLKGLSMLHETYGIVHGDVKPENVLLFDKRSPIFRKRKSSIHGKSGQTWRTSDGWLRDDSFDGDGNSEDEAGSSCGGRCQSDLELRMEGDSSNELCENCSVAGGVSLSSLSDTGDRESVERSLWHRGEADRLDVCVRVCGSGKNGRVVAEGGGLRGPSEGGLRSQSPRRVATSMDATPSRRSRVSEGSEMHRTVVSKYGKNRRGQRSSKLSAETRERLRRYEDSQSAAFENAETSTLALSPSLVLFWKKIVQCKFCDFGLAQRLPEDRKTDPTAKIPWDGVRGSHGYFAPEMLLQHGYDEKIDLWALGIMAFQLLVGYPPFYPPSSCIADAVRFEPRYWKEISSEATDFVSQLLCPDPSRRLSARMALGHPWLTESGPLGSVGRFDVDSDKGPEKVVELLSIRTRGLSTLY